MDETEERGLIRFWLTFDYGPPPGGITTWNPGPSWVGVTAFDYEDALRIVRHEYFPDEPLPPLKSIVEDVDISTIDVLRSYPYYSVPIWRGIWYPAHWSSGLTVDDSAI